MSTPLCPLCISPQPNDESVILSTQNYRIVWANEPNYPCFIRVIWSGHIAEMTDLSMAQQQLLLHVVLLVERVLRDTLSPMPDKINLASLGNQVPHLHWHIVPRYNVDAHWPNSPFGMAVRSIDPQWLNRLNAQRASVAQAIRQVIMV
jgi:diadenosine tetraphosphate (Ap4A) HIT family hydrolase